MQALKRAIDKNRQQLRVSTHEWLMGYAHVHVDLAELVARMLASQVSGEGSMPKYLGLGRVRFEELMGCIFTGLDFGQFANYGNLPDMARQDEHDELRELFLEHASGQPQICDWVADILVAGCMGGDHLWQDLGLWSRDDLTALIRLAFAPLADKNIHDMKWKKFFYKQLCIREGVYTCRAPSCQECADYAACYSPE